MDTYLAVDLGTTGCRSILFDTKLHYITDSYREYGLIIPRDKWVEQDAMLWWLLTVETIKDVMKYARREVCHIRALSVSSQGITLVPVDEYFNPLCNAISWLDVRAEEQTRQIKEDFGLENMFALTGKPVDAAYFLPKLLWIKENETKIFNKAWKFLMPMDFLIGRLTGNCVTDHTMASGTLMYDIKSGVWSDEILDKYQIPKQKLPKLCRSGDNAGKLLSDVACELGLPEECVVAVGAQDQRCASLGAGLKQGVMTVSLGTSGAVCKYHEEPKTEGSTRIGWSAYVNDCSWVTEGVINTAGVCLRWARDNIFRGQNYDAINNEAKEALERGSNLLFYPYLSGPSSPDFYPDSEGCFYGANLSTGRGDFALAVMEGIAFQIRIILEAMDAFANTRTLILFGGGARSPLWCQIIADVTEMEIRIPETSEAAGAGAAILAGLGEGAFERESLPALECKRIYRPGVMASSYRDKYKRYRDIEYKLWRRGESSCYI